MYANGFFEENRRSPVSFIAVLGLHGAALAAVIMFGTTTFVTNKAPTTTLIDITEPEDPLPDPPPPPPRPDEPTPRPADQVTIADPVAPSTTTIAGPVTPPTTYREPIRDPGPQLAMVETRPVIPDPVRIDAQVDSRYRDALQPPYPREQEAAQREGQVRVRITIGTDGRVTAINQISATNDSFWRVTQRQALNRWRFRPATIDGRPIVSTMTFTITFRLPEA